MDLEDSRELWLFRLKEVLMKEVKVATDTLVVEAMELMEQVEEMGAVMEVMVKTAHMSLVEREVA